MNLSSSRRSRQRAFTWIVLGCVVLGAGYTSWVLLRRQERSPRPEPQVQASRPSVASPEELQEIQKGPYLMFLQEGPHYGEVTLARFDDPASEPARSSLACDRVYYAAGHGICLVYDTSTAAQHPLMPIPTWVKLFGPDLQPRQQFMIEGMPSRARVSPDGKYAAYTVFVSGHAYTDASMSTATVILDTATGASLGNLEEFEVWKEGQRFQAIDFNFWGVTFAQDSNRFYATLRSFHTTYLLQGDLAARRLTVLRENVECPSLSPDGTRLAFKKLTPAGTWQLTVLDLATMQETPLAEKENIDDQVEWLDHERILYQKEDGTPRNLINLFVVPADGSGSPELFLSNATSPAVIREETKSSIHGTLLLPMLMHIL